MSDKIRIRGGQPLFGRIPISGAKNAALPLMCASLLTKDTLTLTNVPYLADVVTMRQLLAQHGVQMQLDDSPATGSSGRRLRMCGDQVANFTAPYDLVRTMRASVLVLGPLLARFGEAHVSLPGGCAIGTRPIDLHLKALEELGATITLGEGYVHATIKGRLQGALIRFDKVSVGATENLLMAASLAEGETILDNAACEPEITDLAHCLVAMGANITGIGTTRLVIQGVSALHGATHRVVSDRIEAGTYAACAAITGGEVELLGADADI
ncbi:MAG: UDP-N-acetylglucosamine 1-carboxyvinyltransferase, partial [Rickettsiales bacterium]|nr:UDP-N-acetylglucosamine 1-carboxyvinyltransferase [Rickettsiales bacterium]